MNDWPFPTKLPPPGIAASPEVPDNDCTPNHLCKGRMVHLPAGEQCDRCGHE